MYRFQVCDMSRCAFDQGGELVLKLDRCPLLVLQEGILPSVGALIGVISLSAGFYSVATRTLLPSRAARISDLSCLAGLFLEKKL